MKLIISDETLRDGKQQVGVNFSINDKLKIAKELAKIGVDNIAVMPAVSKYEENLAKKLLKSSFGDKIYASVMLDKKSVNHAIKLGFRKIIIFSSLSDKLLKIKNTTKNKNLKKASSICKSAKNKGIKIIFAGEDASRADINYVSKSILTVKKYIDGFILCDTVGVLTPTKTKKLVKFIKKNADCEIGVHFHNDRGLADKNSIIAIQNGATILSATVGGIGERAGNADWVKILSELKRKGMIVDGINYPKLLKLRNLVYKLGGSKPAKPYTTRAFWHESGIHINALLKDPLSYNSFLPEKYNKKNKFFFGESSGISSYKFLFGDKYSEKKLIKIRDIIKESSYKDKKSYTEKEIRQLLKKYL
ncbi:MAG: hypothetical protein WC475_00105 [Candidatus Paceibacterota bacterium]